MKYLMYNMNELKIKINSDSLVEKCRKNKKDFTRNRKLQAKDLILFTLNNRGKTLKMELYDYIKEFNLEEVSSPALLKQREKLDENVFKDLTKESLIDFYSKFQNEVKTIKNYLLFAIDGSTCEVPNTPQTRKRYKSLNSTNDTRVARIKLSNCYDVLNNYIVDTEIEEYNHQELELALRHIKNTKYIKEYNPIINVMDRGYFSITQLYYLLKQKENFVIRLNRQLLKKEQSKMTSDDEIVEIEYEYNRVKNFKDKHEEVYQYYESGKTISIRIVNITLDTGEIETLITNLSQEEFTRDDLKEIYRLRWGIENNYHELKESMMITNISSSKETIINQEIYSQMLVCNIIHSIENDLNTQINQKEHKHPMKINFNMAVGFVKRFLVKILIEEEDTKRKELSEILFNNILKNLVPIRKGRKSERSRNKKLTNKHPINKRKSI